MNPSSAKKLLIMATGVLFLLLGYLYQLRGTHTKKANVVSSEASDRELAPRLRSSLLQQRKNFQRCWLQNPLPALKDQTWQIFLTVEASGHVKKFELLNSALFEADTEKCLREIALRLKFPTFEGEEFSFTIPIVISNISENR